MENASSLQCAKLSDDNSPQKDDFQDGANN
jgi:hypothetical protein